MDQEAVREVPCFLCGVCCSKYHVRVEAGEARLIAERTGVTWQYFLEHHTEPAWPGVSSFLLKRADGKCLFLQRGPKPDTFVCGIHSFKPRSCIEWNASLSRRECREGLETLWQTKVGPCGELEGEAANVTRFETFLDEIQ